MSEHSPPAAAGQIAPGWSLDQCAAVLCTVWHFAEEIEKQTPNPAVLVEFAETLRLALARPDVILRANFTMRASTT